MRTEILAINDRSGSMQCLAADVIGGFNQFLHDQQAVEGEARITLVQFNDQVERLYEGMALTNAPFLSGVSYRPQGGTALFDAICRTLEQQGKRITEEGWAELVIVCITTDGHENASREYTLDDVQRMVSHAQDHGWRFVFLAANQDVFAAAKTMGIPTRHAHAFAATPEGVGAAYGATTVATTEFRTGKA